jgi:cell division initiation protein
MSRSPEEIRSATFEVVVRGFDRSAVTRVLQEAAESCETAQRERDALQARVGELETELARFQEMERLLRDTLVVAQRSGEEIRSQAQQDADALVSDARAQAASIVGDSEAAIDQQIRQLDQLRRDEEDLRARVSDVLRSALARWEDAEWPGSGAGSRAVPREAGLPPIAVDAGSSLLGSSRPTRSWDDDRIGGSEGGGAEQAGAPEGATESRAGD